MQINDLVTINDESNSIIYIIEEMNDDIVLLKGFTCRVKKYKRISEITKATIEHINIEKEKLKNQERKILRSNKMRTNAKPLFGRILHIDGDKDYLESCMNLYKEMNIYAEGIYIREKDIKNKIEDIILKTTPDIVVITGHDVYNGKGYKDLTNYENTVHYIDVVRLIRKKYYYNDVVIIVGACGSNYEALIASGANFASSPSRINIHTYDPAVIAIAAASTSVDKNIDFNKCLMLIENGKKAFGGVETKGKMRLFY